jgi:hypothetical protein
MNKTKQAFTTQHGEQGHKDNTVEVKMLIMQKSAHDNVFIKKSLNWGQE